MMNDDNLLFFPLFLSSKQFPPGTEIKDLIPFTLDFISVSDRVVASSNPTENSDCNPHNQLPESINFIPKTENVENHLISPISNPSFHFFSSLTFSPKKVRRKNEFVTSDLHVTLPQIPTQSTPSVSQKNRISDFFGPKFKQKIYSKTIQPQLIYDFRQDEVTMVNRRSEENEMPKEQLQIMPEKVKSIEIR
jgi:hypothetical protein